MQQRAPALDNFVHASGGKLQIFIFLFSFNSGHGQKSMATLWLRDGVWRARCSRDLPCPYIAP
jgi:hypothetical protein